MLAFILAALIFGGTILSCILMAFAAGMSDNVSAANNVPVTSTFVIGTIIAVLVAASHWLPPS